VSQFDDHLGQTRPTLFRPILGGSLTRPNDRFPKVFTGQFWKEYPYFLPCVATSGFIFGCLIITALLFAEVGRPLLNIACCRNSNGLHQFRLRAHRIPKPMPCVLHYHPILFSSSNEILHLVTSMVSRSLSGDFLLSELSFPLPTTLPWPSSTSQ